MNAEAATTATSEPAAVQDKKQHPEKSKKKSSSSSKKEHKSNKDEHEHKSSKDEKDKPSKKKSSSSKSSSKSKQEDKAAKEDKKDKGKENTGGVKMTDDEDTQKMIAILNEDIWTATTAEATATVLQSLQDLLSQDTKNSQCMAFSVEMGAPLLVARKMKDFANDTAVQLVALELLQTWTKNGTKTLPSSWYPLLIRISALARVQDILTTTEATTDEWQGLQDKALSILEQMANSPAGELLVEHQGVETFTTLFVQSHKNKTENLLPRVSEVLYHLANTMMATDARDKVVAELCQLLLQDRAENGIVTCQTAALELVGKLLANETTAVGIVPLLVRVKGWARIQDILTEGNDLKERSEEIAKLQDKAMGLYEKMAASNHNSAELLVQNQGVDTLKCIVQGKNGALIPRALEVLYQLSAMTGTDGRSKITEEMGELLRDSRHVLLQTAIISLLSEMAVDEETAQGLVQGQGVESLVYAWEACRADRPTVSDKALDLLVLLSVKGGTASRQAIANSGFLTTISAAMKAEPANDIIHTRGRQVAQALVADHGPVVDESGILTM